MSHISDRADRFARKLTSLNPGKEPVSENPDMRPAQVRVGSIVSDLLRDIHEARKEGNHGRQPDSQ